MDAGDYIMIRWLFEMANKRKRWTRGEFLNMSPSDINKLDVNAMYDLLRDMYDVANKRLKRLADAAIADPLIYETPALSKRAAAGGKFRVGEVIKKKSELSRELRYMQSWLDDPAPGHVKTSSVQGARAYIDKVLQAVHLDRTHVDRDTFRDAWTVYKHWMEEEKLKDGYQGSDRVVQELHHQVFDVQKYYTEDQVKRALTLEKNRIIAQKQARYSMSRLAATSPRDILSQGEEGDDDIKIWR